MGPWTAFMVVAILLIVTLFVLQIVKIATRHHENIERIRRGYPTICGDVPFRAKGADEGAGSEERKYGEN